MLRFLLFRLLQFPLIIAIIYLITFALVWIIPGSPFERTDRRLDPKTLETRKALLHAESWQSFLAHYPRMILLHGDFGPSLGDSPFDVNARLKRGLPVSMTLGVCALMIAIIVGTVVGVTAAVRRGGALEWISLSIALIGISVPTFISAAVLLIVFGVTLKWVTIGSWGRPLDYLLPAIALSLLPMAYIARLTRVAMLDVLSADFIRTARAKGVSRTRTIWKHALKNAILPVLSYLGPAAAAALTGSFVVEKVFNIPGLGEDFINSVLNRDSTLILGTVIVYSSLLLAMNLVVDVLYTVVDPRIDLQGAA